MATLAIIALFVALSVVPTLIVYRWHRGHLSFRASNARALFHYLRVFGWLLFGLNLFVFAPLWIVGRVKPNLWTYPWWGILFILAMAGIGYGLQRLGKFLLQDEDLKNILGRGLE
jgi:hypothetical protein